MRKLSLAVITYLILNVVAFAQLPANPEDISPLLIGEKLPDVTIKDMNGKEISTGSLWSGKKTVLIFYRGGWCPYCNAQLNQLSLIEKDIIDLGYQLVAVSADGSEKLQESLSKNDLHYTLLSDAGGVFSKAVGIAFKAPGHYEKLLKDSQSGNTETFLPVPSVFIISGEGEILFEYINPNYKVRISSELLMGAAKALAR
jgi:peroxiredoxin